MKNMTAKKLLKKMEQDRSYREVNYGELQRQLETWDVCSICGQRYTPSRTSEPGQCSDEVRHFKIRNEGKVQTARRCAFCNRIITDVHENGRRVRSDRIWCSDSCRTRASQTRKESQNGNGRGFTDISQESLA